MSISSEWLDFNRFISSGSIFTGVLDGNVNVQFRYQHVSKDGSLKSGSYHSTPSRLEIRKIQRLEKWTE
ncbi:hypothetical protein [Bacillus sp. Bos-x628]|uniref:hypothetical protein n=1 Tax=Bacillus maqinnsis TaxID=3229854 RepID=UPI00338EECC6